MTQITDHLADIRQRVELALDRCGRTEDSIAIVAVSKQQPASRIRNAVTAGLREFGENYLQEALQKMTQVTDCDICWHFIGRIQANKTRQIAERFCWVETVDRDKIAERLNAHRPQALAPLNVLIQLNLDAEPQKSGVPEAGILPLARLISSLPRLTLRGVMAMPPAGQTAAARRTSFLAVAAAAGRLRDEGFALDTISMGMSEDFELAIECGATMIRVGSALFGPRAPAG